MEQMKPSQEDAMVRRFMMKKLLTHSASMFLFAVQVKNTVKYIATHKKKKLLTSPAAASDHLLCPLNGNKGKCNGDLEPRPGNGYFIVCNCPGLGKGPLMLSMCP